MSGQLQTLMSSRLFTPYRVLLIILYSVTTVLLDPSRSTDDLFIVLFVALEMI